MYYIVASCNTHVNVGRIDVKQGMMLRILWRIVLQPFIRQLIASPDDGITLSQAPVRSRLHP